MATSPHMRRPRLPSPDAATPSLLESLPPAMLDDILCRLPVRDAVRTSALSRSWRRRWKSVPYEVLHWPVGTPPLIIYDVLAQATCPVREFRHPYVPEQDFSFSNLWLDVLARVGVDSLSVKFQWSEVTIFHTLTSRIFSCHQLAVLNLECCDMPSRPPRFQGFPNLTTLSLSHVGFPLLGVRELEGLISSSPLLQTLRLENLRIGDVWTQWVIHAPNLQSLLIRSKFDYGWQINHLPAIEVAAIEVAYPSDDRFVNLISVLDKARKLKLLTPFSMENIMEGLARSFVNLKSLSLHIPFCYRYNILSILYLVRNAPKLEVLDIEFDEYERIHIQHINSLNVPWADDLFSSLTSVNMKNVIWDPFEMLFMEFVLSKARQLEVFSIQELRRRSESDEDAIGEVTRYRRASPGVNVVISRMP